MYVVLFSRIVLSTFAVGRTELNTQIRPCMWQYKNRIIFTLMNSNVFMTTIIQSEKLAEVPLHDKQFELNSHTPGLQW